MDMGRRGDRKERLSPQFLTQSRPCLLCAVPGQKATRTYGNRTKGHFMPCLGLYRKWKGKSTANSANFSWV